MTRAVVRLGAGAVVISVALAVLSAAVTLTAGPVTLLQEYLDVASEANLPTWWSTLLLTVAAVTYGVVALAARLAGVSSRFWVLGAVLLVMLSLAEHTGLHERLDGVSAQLLGRSPLTADWLPLGAAAGLAAAAAMAIAARHAGKRRGWLALGGLALLLAGALGGEVAARLWLARVDPGHPAHVLTYHGAELAENLGAILLLAAAATAVSVRRDGGVLRLRYRDCAATAGATAAPASVGVGVR